MEDERMERRLKKALRRVDLLERLIEDKTRELYLAREQLKVTNIYLQGVIQTIVDALVVVNSEGLIQTVNKAAIDLLGISECDLVGKPVEKIFFKGFVEGLNIDDLISKGFVRGVEKTYLAGGVKKIPVLFSSAVMKDNSNEVKGIVCVALDITERKKQDDKIKELAEIDELTKVYNRRMFLEFLGLELKKARRYSRPFSVVMFDIDHFKKINDDFGHHAGDGVLQCVVDTARAAARDTDILARYGGEEFMVIAVETRLAGAEILAEKIRGCVGSRAIEAARAVTVSLGVTEWRPDDTADSLLERVDEALYVAKNTGRDRAVSL